MGRIHRLSASVSDQIAAGEVVERPASVVKELVENSLDAGATTILVELEDGGRDLIRVSDDGQGMDVDDARIAIERHATSKIQVATDLIGVPTYGFRGEALASIASVSRFEMETAQENLASGGPVGTRVMVRGGRLEGCETIARTHGTTVTVRKLFANTPVRRKFLRSARSETRAASEALTLLALTRLDVSFTLRNDGRKLVDAPRVNSAAERMAALFNRKLVDQLLPVDHMDGYLSVRGFIQRPAAARASGRKAYLFVNQRPFRDHFLVRAAEAGYRATIAPGLRPSVFMSLGVPGDRVDVNVHPTKHEVRFRDKMIVERAVEDAVRSALRPLAAAATVGSGPNPASGATLAPTGEMTHTGHGPLSTESAWTTEDRGTSLFDDQPGIAAAEEFSNTLLQLFNTYIVFETADGLTIVDQHSAHERVLYEQAMRELKGEGAAAQRLLLPMTVDLSSNEIDAVEQNKEHLAHIGYEVEPFGGQSVVIHAVPNPHPRFDARGCFEELVADLARGRFGGLTNRLERFAATFGCRAAVKAGQVLDPAEMRDLLRRLFACELPPHDVHGRPTIVQLPKQELERRFGRA
jgi:DNA mismatch repair protein MutL